ncbi:MAG: hypothetical protein VB144_11735 [Clostridia bacterium]|nr:hypothetical protein [Clostridia bacterium]
MTYEWCRLYNKIMDNQAMRGMPGDWFRAWIFMMVLANKSSERGVIHVADTDGLASLLCIRAEDLEPLMKRLAVAEMAQWREDGSIELINFRELQYDYPSTRPEAVAKRKSRAKQQTQPTSENEPGTRTERGQNEDRTRTERGTEYRCTDSTPLLSPRERMDFDTFWAAYPSRQRQNRKGAEDAWARLIHTADDKGNAPDPAEIIDAARNYDKATASKVPKFIQLAVNFLGKHTWEDYVHGIPDADKPVESATPVGRYIPNAEETRRRLDAEEALKRQIWGEEGEASG